MSEAAADRPSSPSPGWPVPIDAARAQRSAMADLMTRVGRALDLHFADYPAFHRWSCSQYPSFWARFLATLNLPLSGNVEPACIGQGVAGTEFFPELRLNFAQCLLRRIDEASEHAPALVLRTEQGERVTRTRVELRARCLRLAGALREAGIRPGDRIVAIGRNSPELVEAFVASAAIGATWSSVSPDLGVDAVLARFGELGATVAFVDLRHVHHGQTHDTVGALREILPALTSLRLVVTLHDHDLLPPYLPSGARLLAFSELLAGEPMALERLTHFAFNHPLCILFTSGTTGKPKCLVHGAGGTLLEHLKEHRLHAGFGPQDRLLFYTTCGWMMWNWMVSGLASAMPLVIYDGSATYPTPGALLDVLADERVTVFGTSPAYLQLLQSLQIEPRATRSLEALRTIQSTGSVLHPHQFDWIRESFGPVAIESISGGTDIVGCFVLGNPCMPQVRGDSQCLSLAMDVRASTDAGHLPSGEGDLVCLTPFPSRPVAIWGDDDGRRLQASYYAANPGAWTHGDRLRIDPLGSARILGRSDGILNIRGVRIGPAEIQSIAVTLPGIREAMALAQDDPREPGGSRLVLLVVLEPGITLDRPLTLQIKKTLKQRASAVHVPSLIAAVPALPMTHSGKLAEAAARAALNHQPVRHPEALRNPQALQAIAALANPVS